VESPAAEAHFVRQQRVSRVLVYQRELHPTLAATTMKMVPTLALLCLAQSFLPRPVPSQTPPDTEFTQAERNGLQMSGDSIWHPLLGFALPHPGPMFARDSALDRLVAQQFSARPDIIGWALRVPNNPRLLLIIAARLSAPGEDAFRGFATGLRQAIQHATPVSETLEWADSAGDYRLTMRHVSAAYFSLRCLSRPRQQVSLVVCVQSTGEQPNEHGRVQGGLHLANKG
jgi:hypothetical protein